MKSRHILTFILLAIIMAGVVSAAEDADNSTLSVHDESPLESPDIQTETFTNLTGEIEKQDRELNIAVDYRHEESDGDYTNGILINKTNFIVNGNGHTIDGSNRTRIFHITGTNITIKNLIFKNAIGFLNIDGACNITTMNVTFMDRNNNINKIGAVRVVSTQNYTSINDKFIECYARDYASAIYVGDSEMTLKNATFSNENPITWSLIYGIESNINIANTTFSNIASGYAAAVYNEYGETRIKNSRFINLSAAYTGGALAFKGRSLIMIEDCQFINVSSSNDGGAVFTDINHHLENQKSKVIIRNTLFNNCSSSYGGAYIQLGGSLEITDSTFTANRALCGGAVYTSNVSSKITGTLFEDNSASSASAIFYDNGNLQIFQCNFTNNTQAIWLCDSYYKITDSIFKNNTQAIYSEFDRASSFEKNNTNCGDEISLDNENYPPYVFEMGQQIVLNPIEIGASINDTYFDLRDYGAVSSVKDQKDRGSCWAFTLTDALESAYYLATGMHIDVSPNNLENFPLRYSPYGYNYYTEANSPRLAIGYFLSWLGFVEEDYASFDELGKIYYPLASSDTFHILNAIVTIADDKSKAVEFYKGLLLKYGEISITTYGPYDSSSFYNHETFAEYCDDINHCDHTVTIVGWNDSFPASNFNTNPPGDGAWIAKNSWGEDWADGGYYYISYYEQPMINRHVCAFIFDNVINYNKIYQYDFIAPDARYISEYGESLNCTNYYESTGDDLIAAVGTYFNKANTTYTITIYVNGTEVYSQSGKSLFGGYNTIELDRFIPVKMGDIFAVKVESDGIYVIRNTRQHFMAGRSIMTDYAEITDLADRNMTGCIKAYTLPAGSDSFKTLEMEIYEADTTFAMRHDYIYGGDDDLREITITRSGFTIDGQGHTIDARGCVGIFNITGRDVILKNITFVNANALAGAAILCHEDLTVIDCIFKNNTASIGGAVSSLKNLTVINSTFIQNKAMYGGAIEVENNVTLIDSRFIQNTASQGGGAVYSFNASVENCHFEANRAREIGAIMIRENGRINNTIFVKNIAQRYGAAYLGRSQNITNSYFKDNIADVFGGALITFGTGTIDRTTFENNSATAGGAMFVCGNLTVSNTIFVNNSVSKDGPDIFIDMQGEVRLVNVTPDDIKVVYNIYPVATAIINATYPDAVKIMVSVYYDKMPYEVDGKVTMQIGEKTYQANITAGKATLELYDLDPGIYTERIVLDCGENYARTSQIVTFKVKRSADSFKMLQEEINSAGDILILESDYIYDPQSDTGSIIIGRDNFTIDGQGHKIDARGYAGIFNITGKNATVKNITFINGNQSIAGGAIVGYRDINIIDCIFTNNTAPIGGAVYCWNASINNCQFKNNTPGYGGAVYINENAEINGSRFIENRAWYGGALYVLENLTLNNSYFANNTAEVYGGAIFLFGYGTIDNTIFENNSAYMGGALCLLSPTSISNTIFKDNRAIDGGNEILLDGTEKAILNNVTPEDISQITYIYLAYDVDAVEYGDSVKIKIFAYPLNKDYTVNGNVSIQINGRTYTEKIIMGNATIEIADLNPGTYSGTLVIDCGENYTRTSLDATFEVLKRNITITAKDKSYVINYGGKYTVSISNLVSNVKVTFALNGKDIGSATTTSKGTAEITLTAKMLKAAGAGKINLNIKIIDEKYNAASKTVKITISKEKSKIAAKKKTFKKSKKVKKYTVTLKNSKGKAIKKAKVTLKVKGKTYKAKTNSKGKATFKISKLTKKGTHKAVIKYKGDKYYKKASKTVKIKIK